ncbi:NUDIX hydrolase [Nocardia sp. NBC_01329]|uniref:NUDIX hydrolase n=1 Tax=Nocardia sp. NBC_01329 TaxID=2903594 RepID=UPI002E15864A|nr:NUDIX domain-containing protein [Nocardia sp. NBC_01329]
MRPGALARTEQRLRAAARRDGVTDLVVGVAVFRDGKLLVVRRVPGDYLGGMYELPGGGVESGESLTEGVARELLEETGLVARRITDFLGSFDYATRTKAKVRKFSFLVEAAPGEITLDPDEHDDYAWIDARDLGTLPMAPDMREAVDLLIAERVPGPADMPRGLRGG